MTSLPSLLKFEESGSANIPASKYNLKGRKGVVPVGLLRKKVVKRLSQSCLEKLRKSEEGDRNAK